MYLTYEQYQAAGGKLTETEFDRYLLAAERKIDRATFDRVINFEVQPERTQKCVRQCAFELVGLGADEDTANTEKYQSMSNNGVSVSLKERNFDRESNDIINNWLGGVRDANGTALLYAGVSATDKPRQEPVPEPPTPPEGEYATKADIEAAIDAKICGMEFFSASDIAVWTNIPGHIESLMKGAILRTLNDDPDFEYIFNISSGKYELQPLPRLHATKVEVAASGGTTTLQDVLTAMDERLYALENK